MKSASEKTSKSERLYLSLAGGRAAAGFQLGVDSSNEGTWLGNVGVALTECPFRRRATSVRTRHMMSSIDKFCGVDRDEVSCPFSSVRSLRSGFASRISALRDVLMILSSQLKRNPLQLLERSSKYGSPGAPKPCQ